MDERAVILVPADEFFVEPCGFLGKDSGDDLDTGVAQAFKSFA